VVETLEAMQKRRSIRRYRPDAIPDEHLGKLLDAARIAPSTSNTQSWKFKVVTDRETRQKIREAAYGQRFVEEAPAVIACCIDFDAFKERGKQTLRLVLTGKVRPSLEMMLRAVRGGKDAEFDPERVVINAVMNVTIAAEHIVLAATSLGLGTCWVRAFEAPEVERILELPDAVKSLALLTVGYPAESPAPRPRRSLEEIVL
jgi:nitroreductase